MYFVYATNGIDASYSIETSCPMLAVIYAIGAFTVGRSMGVDIYSN